MSLILGHEFGAAALLALLLCGLAYAVRKRPRMERVLVLGGGPLACKLIAAIERRPDRLLEHVGVVCDPDDELPEHSRRLGCFEELEEVVESVRPQRIAVALASPRGRLPVQSLLDLRMEGIAVDDGVELYERLTGKLAIESLVPSRLIYSREGQTGRWSRRLSRGLNVCVAAVGLALAAPLIALVACAVLLHCGRPVFFLHERVGLAGRRFHLIKFRTMRAAPRPTSEWETDNLARVTRLGRWLRGLRLDELPQFWNVLRGDMNLVGPRPHPVTNLALFSERIPYYRLRLAVRPGITGWAQVRYGYANNLEEETEKMRYDLYYVKHMSPWLDLRVLFDTVRIALLGHPLERERFAPQPTLPVH